MYAILHKMAICTLVPRFSDIVDMVYLFSCLFLGSWAVVLQNFTHQSKFRFFFTPSWLITFEQRLNFFFIAILLDVFSILFMKNTIILCLVKIVKVIL